MIDLISVDLGPSTHLPRARSFAVRELVAKSPGEAMLKWFLVCPGRRKNASGTLVRAQVEQKSVA